jgi:hypothetical protein
MRLRMVCAVAALAATALPFPERALGYCRGCVIEPLKVESAALIASADASALPLIEPSCHMEKQRAWKPSRKKWRRVEICE